MPTDQPTPDQVCPAGFDCPLSRLGFTTHFTQADVDAAYERGEAETLAAITAAGDEPTADDLSLFVAEQMRDPAFVRAWWASYRAEQFGLRASRDAAFERGRERGLREATEGWERAVATLRDVADRTGSPAARWAADYLTADPDARRVGPWEPAPAVNAEQPSPSRCAWVPIPGGRCPHCGEHGADEQSEPPRGGTVATEPDTRAAGPVLRNDLVDFSVGIGEGGPTRRAERRPTRGMADGCGREHTYRDGCEHAEDGA
jgi:hypothetical protein